MTFNYEQSYKIGHTYNIKVAKFLNDHGIEAYATNLEIATNKTEWRKFTENEQDIILPNHENKNLEVKSSTRHFNWNPQEFPHPNTIVDTCYGYHNKKHPPHAYILISQHTGAMLAIPPKTQPQWTTKKLYDKHRQIWDDFYLIPKHLLQPINKLIQHLQQTQHTPNK